MAQSCLALNCYNEKRLIYKSFTRHETEIVKQVAAANKQ